MVAAALATHLGRSAHLDLRRHCPQSMDSSMASHKMLLTRLWLVALVVVRPIASPAQSSAQMVNTASGSDGLPLTPARVVRFRVTEGTWMSLDVSPDGQTIVFDLLGDLYTLPITGGRARRLTEGMAINRQPRYSPDGRWLVFVSDRSGRENVWIADRDGRQARQLSDLHRYGVVGAVMSPAWSPDGRTIVVSQRLGATRAEELGSDTRRFMWLIAAYDVETRQMRWVSDTAPEAARSALGPSFDARHHALYAAIHLGPLPSSSVLGYWRIGRLDLATGRLFPEMGGNVGRVGLRPAVSPNGRLLVYASSSGSHLGLRVRDLATDRERWLVREALDDPSGQEGSEPRDPVPGYGFTPDSKSLVAAYGGRIHRIDLATGRAVIIPFIADVERALGPLTVRQFTLPEIAVRSRGVLQPALSPDGQRVAFCALDRIWIMELPHAGSPASQPRRLTTDSIGEFYPTWSPDGRWLAYTTWRDGEGGAVWRAGVPLGDTGDAATPERLTTDTALYFHPAASPDGVRIVAVRLDVPTDRALLIPSMFLPARPVKPQLIWVPSRGGAPRTVASLPSAVGVTLQELVKQVYFTTDPERIYVGLSSWGWDGADHHLALVVKDWDGAVQREKEPFFIDGVLSPDSRRGLVSIGNMLYEVGLTAGSARRREGLDTLDLERVQGRPFGGAAVAAKQWGTALKPWISWSHDGRRAIFAQGGALYMGDAPPEGWTKFQRVEVPLMITSDVPRGTIAFRGARLITMRGREIIERGDLVVRDNRIAAVGPAGRVAIPPGARIINAGGTTILPGYVDIHEHSWRPYGVHPEQFWASLLEVAYGVTSVRDPFSRGENDDFAYADRERNGDFLGPRTFSTGPPLLAPPYPSVRTLDDAQEAVRRHAEDFRTETFKFYSDEDRRARQLLAMAARKAGLNATIHNNGGDLALASVIDGLTGIEHRLNIKIYDDVATLIAHSGVTLAHTYLGALFGSMAYVTRRHGVPLDYPKIRRFVPPSAREATCVGCTGDVEPGVAPLELDNMLPMVGGAARIVARGGRIGMGSHGNIVGIGFHYEMWLHALGGLPNHEILRSATIVGATAIGHGNDLGSLEPDKLADLQILDRNPLLDIHHTTSIRYVMKNGRLYEAEDLTEIWPRHRRLAPIYFWEGHSSTDGANGRGAPGKRSPR